MYHKVSNSRASVHGLTVSKPRSLQGMNVLVVEDEVILAMDMTEELQKFGATVIGPARTLAQALHLANNNDITVAILDVNLNGDSSFPVAELLSQRNVPFIFQTGYLDTPMMNEKWPSTTILIKPIDFSLLIDCVAALSKRS